MRIGIITGEYPPMQGGVGAYTSIVAHRLHELGHEVYIFTSAENVQEVEGIHVTTWTGGWNWRVWGAIAEWAKTHYLCIVNLQFQTAAFDMSPWVHFLQNRLDVPLVTTFHDLRHPYLFPKAGGLRDWIVRYLARSSAGVITTNHEDYAQIAHLPHLAMIPIGSNIHVPNKENYTVSSWREKMDIQEHQFLLAHFGFVNHSKGLETLLDAIALIKRQGIPICLMMIGGRVGSSDATNATFVQKIDAQIARLGLDDDVHWTGFVNDDEVSGYLWAADVTTLPYRDGASFRRGSLMAAIEHQCAIVSTEPKVAIPEFQHGKNIILCPPDDVDSLAKTLIYLYEHRDAIEKLQMGAAELRHHFNWQTIVNQTVQFFERIQEGNIDA
jgi:glycosyltransferase involved in cell wall biosynthesis